MQFRKVFLSCIDSELMKMILTVQVTCLGGVWGFIWSIWPRFQGMACFVTFMKNVKILKINSVLGLMYCVWGDLYTFKTSFRRCLKCSRSLVVTGLGFEYGSVWFCNFQDFSENAIWWIEWLFNWAEVWLIFWWFMCVLCSKRSDPFIGQDGTLHSKEV